MDTTSTTNTQQRFVMGAPAVVVTDDFLLPRGTRVCIVDDDGRCPIYVGPGGTPIGAAEHRHFAPVEPTTAERRRMETARILAEEGVDLI